MRRLVVRGRGTVPPEAGAGTTLDGDAPPALDAACHAPFGNLFLDPLGEAKACCVSSGYPLGDLARDRLPDIWSAPRTVALRRAMVEGDFSKGCGYCEGRLGAGLSSVHHTYDAVPADSLEPPFPRRLEINISNACNLQCVMCNGDYSSAIRLHREGRPALPKVYGDEFFDDLAAIVPHLIEVSFTGGEPFLVPEYYRIWDMIAELNPDLPVRITTNGTQWNRRVERVLGMLRCEINVSIDGFTKETYEAVRVGADHATVFANLERFVASCRERGTPLSIYHCLMPQNYHELGDLLLLGDRLDVGVQVCVVQVPLHCSLEAMEDWTDLRATFEHFNETVRPQLGRNAWVFDDQYKRIVEGGLLPAVFGFPRVRTQSAGPAPETGTTGAVADATSPTTITIGCDERITSVSPAMAALVGRAPDALVGRTLDALDEAMADAFGPRSSMATRDPADDRTTTETTYGVSRFRSTLAARRQPDGWLDHVELVVEPLG